MYISQRLPVERQCYFAIFAWAFSSTALGPLSKGHRQEKSVITVFFNNHVGSELEARVRDC